MRHVSAGALIGMVALAVATGGTSGLCADGEKPLIHAVVDIAHEFTFYMDGRFSKNYVTPTGGKGAQNWATLHTYDFSNVNVLVLQNGASPCPYLPKDVAAVRQFLDEGGGVVVLGDYATFRGEKKYHLNDVVRVFGAEFVNRPAKAPLRASARFTDDPVKTYNGKTIDLRVPSEWDRLITDANGRVVLARRSVGKGVLVVSSRALCGRKPNAGDPINDRWWQPLLLDLAKNKKVDPKQRPPNKQAENEETREGLKIRYTEYLRPCANEIFAIYKRCRPEMERLLGVPPSKGMMSTLILLPTGGGGFSSGRSIGLGVWWGGFPEKKYGMIELLGHEGTHSWVLPFAEPMWNEGIATYVGIQLGRRMGLEGDAKRTLDNWIKGAKRHDPEMNKMDIAHGKNVPHVVRMAKPMWIFERLSEAKPDILARYFRAKRRLAAPPRKRYSADDCVAVLSVAMETDLFPWFQSLGVTVDPEKTDISFPKGQ